MVTVKAPTIEQIQAAEEYALAQLCSEIPTKLAGPGYTEWDSEVKACKYKEKACNPAPENPFSQWPMTSGGEYRDFKAENNPHFKELWRLHEPEMLVMKTTPTSGKKTICSRGSPQAYQWCQFPTKRSDGFRGGETNVKAFKYQVIQGEESCEFTKGYCDSKGLAWNPNNETCYKDTGLQVAEFFGLDGMVQNIRAYGWSNFVKSGGLLAILTAAIPPPGLTSLVGATFMTNIALARHKNTDYGRV